MRLSEIVDRIFDALEERLEPDQRPSLEFGKGILRNIMMRYGDLDLNIEIRHVPVEVAGDEGQKET
jgi:hypothetical protein